MKKFVIFMIVVLCLTLAVSVSGKLNYITNKLSDVSISGNLTVDGNVGIGTISPEARLHISDGVALYDTDRNLTSLYHLVDKRYVDEAVTALGARYYMLDTDSGIANYKDCSLIPSADSEQDTSITSISDDDYLVGWIAPNANEPDKLLTGVYNWRLYAEKTGGTETLRLYWKLVERKSDTSEEVIGTSVVSNEITSGKNSCIIPLTLSADHDIASDSYVVGKIYADVSGSGSAPSITLYYEGNSDSHWEIPVNTEILDGRYVNADGDTMTGGLTTTVLTADSTTITSHGTPWDLADSTYTGTIVIGQAGVNTSFGDLCYLYSSGKYLKAQADSTASMPARVMCIERNGIATDSYGKYLHEGYIKLSTWSTVQTIGSNVYVDDDTAGLPTTTQPPDSGDQVQIVGYCIATDIMYFNPSPDVGEVP